jgi:uncharacterized protein (DUF58 family)
MGVRLAVLSVAIGLAAVNTGNNLLYVMLSLILGLAVVSTLAARRAMRTLRVQVEFPPEVVCGEPFLVAVEASGSFPWLPQTWVDVRVDGLGEPLNLTVAVPASTGRGRAVSRVSIGRRGVHTRLALFAATGYPLDLAVSRRESFWQGEIVVLPRFERVASPGRLAAAAGAQEAGPRFSREPGTGAELRQVRGYTWNDDARRMHWRATARAGHPMVRELEQEHERAVDLVLDTAAPDAESFEAVVSRAAALLDAARRERVPMRLFAPGAAARGLAGAAAARFLAEVQAVPPGMDRGEAPGPVPAGALVVSCDPACDTTPEAA